MKVYLTTAFSPSMLPRYGGNFGGECKIEELSPSQFEMRVNFYRNHLIPAVGHENTAQLLAKKLERVLPELPALYNRVSIGLEPGDVVLVAIPQFRADQAREFTDEELSQAPFRYFKVEVK